MNWLPNDDARCNGRGNGAGGWHKDCETCLRRTAPRDGIGPNIGPPADPAAECTKVIKPTKKHTPRKHRP